MSNKSNKNNLTVADIIFKWYVFAIIGYTIGKSLGSTINGLIWFIIFAFIGWQLQKYHNTTL